MRETNDPYERGRGASTSEEPVEIGRYMGALRRSRWLIAAAVIFVTAAVAALSEALPKNYEATASIVANATNDAASTEAIQRELTTVATLATTRPVLAEAAKVVHGETVGELEEHTSAAVDANANIIHISVSSHSPRDAALLAAAVARAFIAQHAAGQQAASARALATVQAEIEALRAKGLNGPAAANQLAALQTRAGQIETARAGANTQLQLIQPPSVPTSPVSPRPVRNAVIALFVTLFLAIVAVLAREQLMPRIGNQRELGYLLEVPVLASIPYRRRRVDLRSARIETESFQTLAAATQLAVPADSSPRVILVTSAGPAEGKTTVTAALAGMLARSGRGTLLVSGDLRSPRLDDTFDVSGQPGVRELLARMRNSTAGRDPASAPAVDTIEAVREFIVPIHTNGTAAQGALDVLPAGPPQADAATLLQTTALESLMRTLRSSSYAYVLIDSPPLLGIADTQVLARFADEILLVARLDRLAMSGVMDMRETLFRIGVKPMGIVVIGAATQSSYYYYGEPAYESSLMPS
ncbi:MAG TPA: AAA family ATPase [Solirubrobacteraceae bacterium]|nr:AAA family ATPase [Solirubrobacteraceae bacterium]